MRSVPQNQDAIDSEGQIYIALTLNGHIDQ